jgi:hypothetical protein
MAQSDQVVQNATFPSVRADINDNLAALYSQSSGNTAPTVTVAFQPWIDTSSSPPVKKIRNGSNSAWITEGVIDPAGFQVGGVTQIANGGTGATTAAAGLAALLPSQTSNAGKALVTDGSAASWDNAQGAKAWVNFNGTGTVAIRASYNVSSITDNGTGDYTVNFTTALADANYSCVASSGTTASDYRIAVPNFNAAPTSSACRLRTGTPSGAGPATDDLYVNVAIFR